MGKTQFRTTAAVTVYIAIKNKIMKYYTFKTPSADFCSLPIHGGFLSDGYQCGIRSDGDHNHLSASLPTFCFDLFPTTIYRSVVICAPHNSLGRRQRSSLWLWIAWIQRRIIFT